MSTCTIADCERRHLARGLCSAHYQRAQRAGEFVPEALIYADDHDLMQRNTVMTDRGCWEWTGKRNRGGYGSTNRPGSHSYAHRLSYETYVGPIPDGLQIDHLCRNPPCVRPDHLEPVTGRINSLRSNSPMAANARKTHCKRGHRFTPENTRHVTTKYGHQGRACRACSNAHHRRYRQEARCA